MKPEIKKTLIFTTVGLAVAGVAIAGTILVQKLQFKSEDAIVPPAVVDNSVPSGPPMAQVLSVKPHYVSVNSTVNKCYPTQSVVYTQSTQQNTSPAGTVVGGVIGGLAGSTIHGSARNAAILAGAGLGAYTGHEISQNKQTTKEVPHTVYSTKCSTQTVSSQKQEGYEVTYWYNGTQGTIIMDTPPASNMIPLPGAVDPSTAPAATSAVTATATATTSAPVAATTASAVTNP